MHTPPGPGSRPAAFGTHLIEVHDWLREELATLREDLASYLDGDRARPRELRAHCLAFCSAIDQHHTGEDARMFPVLADRFPELRPALAQLERDHHLVAEMLRAVEKLLDGVGPEPGEAEIARVRGELDGMAALLESHFVYEEKTLVAALNSMSSPG